MNCMALLFKFLLLFFVIFCPLNCQAVMKGSLEYKIPIEYSNMNEEELSSKAEFYYNNALKTSGGKLNSDVTQGLILYSALSNKNPDNIYYPIRTGILYDIIGKDRYAKGNYYRAMGINPSMPEPYFYLGEFYYKRQLYRKALKMYLRAGEHGYAAHPQTVARIKEINKMFGVKN